MTEWNVPWADKLKTAYRANYKTDAKNRDRSRGHPLMASLKTDGSPKVQNITFLDFLASDPRVLLFAGATRNQELMSVVKMNQTHELYWEMKQSDESFIISGKAFIICSPALSGRYGVGPRGIQLPDPLPIFPPSNPFPPTSDDFWQSERDRLWKELSSAFRATWTWPNTGEPRMKDNFVSSPILKNSILGQRVPVTPPPATFKCTRLDVILEESSNTNNDLRAIHMAAYDNFCVLVFRVLKVEHQFIGNDGIPGRNLYTVARDGNWGVENLNP